MRDALHRVQVGRAGGEGDEEARLGEDDAVGVLIVEDELAAREVAATPSTALALLALAHVHRSSLRLIIVYLIIFANKHIWLPCDLLHHYQTMPCVLWMFKVIEPLAK